jgi:hypothetical protein
MTSVDIEYLRIPMSMLLVINDIEAFKGLEKENVDLLTQEYSEEELGGIVCALIFAKNNPTYDFKKLLPNVPFSSRQIAVFLEKIHDSIATHSNLVSG